MTLARFTPSVLDGETLEQLFVHRHHLLDDVMTAVRESADGDGRRHRLFVGPRGAGKTHLISLVNHRVRQARESGLRVGLSWLMEDPWEIESYDDLIEQILDEAEGVPEELHGERGILDLAGLQGPLVVLVENLDQVFDAIGTGGQRRLRALLENHRPLLLVATSTRLTSDLLGQSEPFYGFFDVTQLEPFSVEQAADMLRHVAECANDSDLAAVLASPQAGSRLATIAHLAGGQPRVWALLGTGLTDTGIDDMVDMLLARFDDLTPYYQEQLARLSPSERKAVRRLADADRPLTVRDLAELARTDQRTMSKTVSDLRKRGWVRKHESILTTNFDARLTYYELAEPLARIAFQMKASRGEPVRMVVDFLSTWFDSVELTESLDRADMSSSYIEISAQASDSDERKIARALTDASRVTSLSGQLVPRLIDLDDALIEFEATGDPRAALRQPAAISRLLEESLSDGLPGSLRMRIAFIAVACGETTAWVPRLDAILTSIPSGLAHAMSLILLVYADADSRSAVLDELVRSTRNFTPEWLELLANSVGQLASNLETDDAAEATVALADSTMFAALEASSAYLDLRFWSARAHVLRGDLDAGTRTMVRGIAHAGLSASSAEFELTARMNLALIYLMSGRNREAVELCESLPALEFDETIEPARIATLTLVHARALAEFDRERAIHELERIIFDLTPNLRPDARRLVSDLRSASSTSASDTDGVPDGLGLGEGSQAGESGVVGP